MTSRERFKLTLAHKEPDRVPIDVGSDLHNGIHDIAYKNLIDYLGEKDEIVFYDQMQHLAKVKESVLVRLSSDTRYLFANASSDYKFEFASDSSWLDEWGVRRANAGLYDESTQAPLAGCTMDDVKNYKMPNAKDPARFVGLKEKAKDLYENTDYALIGANAASLFFLTSEIVGYQEYMEKILLDTKTVEALVERVLEWQFDFFDGYLDAIGDYVEMVWMGDDWGTQLAPLMNPKTFREMFVSRYAQLTKHIKSKADVKVALHSCGAIDWALDDIAKAGIDVIHPLQGDAHGLTDPKYLKKAYGKDLVFYSNLKNQTTLPFGTEQDVRQDVIDKIEALAPGGGYIMSGGHNFQADVPPENILALIDTTLKYGKYPINIK
jgi:uroporphyrinogen decarboxylase